MNTLASYAKSIGAEVVELEEGCWVHQRDNYIYDPTQCPSHALELMICMRAEIQYLEGKQEAVISSNDGSVSLSRPYGSDVFAATRWLITALALELMKRKR